MLYYNLKKYLTVIQILSLYQRILLLRKAVKRSIEKHVLKMIKKDEWSSVDVGAYLDNTFGMTYLKYFLEVDEKAQVINKLGIDKTEL